MKESEQVSEFNFRLAPWGCSLEAQSFVLSVVDVIRDVAAILYGHRGLEAQGQVPFDMLQACVMIQGEAFAPRFALGRDQTVAVPFATLRHRPTPAGTMQIIVAFVDSRFML